MGGIVFWATEQLETISRFYTERLACTVWLEQADCVVLRFGNMLIGFCRRERVDRAGMLCFVFDQRAEVDHAYGRLRDIATTAPQVNPKYQIYHFFAADPDGRVVECQSFENPVTLP